jgi:gluconolactonase
MTKPVIRVLADELGHPQGPSLAPDGAVLFAETYTGRIVRYTPRGGLETVLEAGGGPNAVLAAPDGTIWFTQNGGQAGAWRSRTPRVPSLQRLAPGAHLAETVATGTDGAAFVAPHDLALGPDGSVYMTDSGTWDPDRRPDSGRIVRHRPDGLTETVLDLGHVYPSGVAVERDGSLVWAECYTNRIYRLGPGATAGELLCELPPQQLPECVTVGPDDTLWVAGLFAEGIVVLDRFGKELDVIHTGGLPLNCVLSDDTLYVADLGDYDETAAADTAQMNGRLLAVTL